MEVIKTAKTLIITGLIVGCVTHKDQLKIEGRDNASEWMSAV